jgi:hypothetical protein
MDHHEKHHQAKEREREEKKKEHAAHVQQSPKGVHPGWLVGSGVVITLIAVLIWTFGGW